MHHFLLATLDLHIWPQLKVSIYFHVTGNLASNHFPIWYGLERNIFKKDIKLAQVTLVQFHSTLRSKVIFMWIRNFHFFFVRYRANINYDHFIPWERYRPDPNYALFSSTLNLPICPWVKIMRHPLVISNRCVK